MIPVPQTLFDEEEEKENHAPPNAPTLQAPPALPYAPSLKGDSPEPPHDTAADEDSGEEWGSEWDEDELAWEVYLSNFCVYLGPPY